MYCHFKIIKYKLNWRYLSLNVSLKIQFAVLLICTDKSRSNSFLVHPPINLWSDTNLLVFYKHDKDKGITFVCSRIVCGFWLIFSFAFVSHFLCLRLWVCIDWCVQTMILAKNIPNITFLDCACKLLFNAHKISFLLLPWPWQWPWFWIAQHGYHIKLLAFKDMQ